MKKWLVFCGVVCTLGIFTLSMAVAADQQRTRDQKRLPKRDGSCQSDVIQSAPAPSELSAVEAEPTADLLAARSRGENAKKSGAANGTKSRKQDRKQEKLKDGTCRS